MLSRAFAALALYAAGTLTYAWACDPVSPSFVQRDTFYDPQYFGRLGIPSAHGYLRVINRVGCYDAPDYQTRGTLNLRFNNAANNPDFTNNPTYLAVQVISTVPNQRARQVLSLYRNQNDRQHPERGFWAHPRGQTKLPDAQPRTQYGASELAIEYETTFTSPEHEAGNGDYGLFTGDHTATAGHDDFVNKFGAWHALLVAPNELRGSLTENDQTFETGRRRGTSYTVVQNTWQDRSIWELRQDDLSALVGQNSIRLRQYLIHYRPFLRQPDTHLVPNHEVTIPIPTQSASCIYVRVTGPNSYGTYFSIVQPTSQQFVALRIDPSAVCTAPPAPESGFASIFSGRAFGMGARAATPNGR
jgi:hypothetical protein